MLVVVGGGNDIFKRVQLAIQNKLLFGFIEYCVCYVCLQEESFTL